MINKTNNHLDRKLSEQELKEAALSLEVGDSLNTTCPFCRTPDRLKMSLTRISEGLLYNCYRASCGARGFISSVPGSILLRGEGRKKRKLFTPREFKGSLEELPEEVLELLSTKYTLTKEELREQGFKYDRDYDSLFMPCFTARGAEFGGVTKRLNYRGKAGTKNLTFFTKSNTGLHYPLTERKGQIALVEDILSAVRCVRYSRTVALLGTHLNDERIRELREQTDSLVVLLDPDATDKAFRYKKKYGFYFKRFEVRSLEADPKDLEEEKLEEVLWNKN